jgi:hypothetical protein
MMVVAKKTTVRRRREPQTFEDRIKPLSHRPKWWRGIIYGEPGVGKSTLAASSSEIGRTLILSADRPDAHEAARNLGYTPDVIDITQHQDLTDAYQMLRHGGYKEYSWVWLDSGTLYQENLMDEHLAEVVAAKPHRDPDVPDKPEYLRTQVRLQKWVRAMRGVPINWGITAHVMSTVDEEDGEVHYMPAFQGGRGALSSKLCGYVGVVGRLNVRAVTITKEGKKVKRTQRVLQVQPQGKFYAKDGFNSMGNEIVRPTMAMMMKLISDKEGAKE